MKATKENVDMMLDNYVKLQYKFININPPRITAVYEARYESYVPRKSDPTGYYNQRKFDTDKEIKELYSEISDVLNKMTREELLYYNDNLLGKKSEDLTAEKLGLSRKGLKPIRNSCILKLAMAFGIEELK